MFDTPATQPPEKVCFNPAKMKIKYAEAAEAAEESFQTLMTLVKACQREGVDGGRRYQGISPAGVIDGSWN